jgi:molybdate transport system substrate-binding protein
MRSLLAVISAGEGGHNVPAGSMERTGTSPEKIAGLRPDGAVMKRTSLLASAQVALAFALAAIFTFPQAATAQNKQPLTVFAAASLKNALDEVNAAWTKQSGVEVRMSYAASSALAKQIEEKAPADLFLSADLQWMDYVEKKDLLRAGTRQSLLGNSLVIVAAKDSKIVDLKIDERLDLAKLLGDGRLSVAGIEAVPAGRYAKAALTKLGLWASVEKKLAEAENVRAALALVSRGEAPLGIVYSTDAAADKGVKVIGTFPADSHPAIIYPVAILNGSKNAMAENYRKYLASPEAISVFTRHGFTISASAKAS